MDLKELRYFRAIAESGTLAKAAVRLRIAQPALSRHMHKLEKSLGVELLVRTSRGVTPTPAGAALLERTVDIEHEIAETVRMVSNFAARVTGSLHIAVQYPVSTLLMPDLVKAYKAMCPNVAIHIVDGYSHDINAALLNERLDMAIVDAPSHEHADLTTLPLWVDRLRLAAPPCAASLPLFRKPTLTLEEIVSLPLVLPSTVSSLRRLIETAFTKRQLHLQPVLEADGQLLNFELVKAGLGYTIFPRRAFADFESRGELISREISPSILRTTALVMRTVLLGDRKVAPMVSLVRQAVARLVSAEAAGDFALYHDAASRLAAPVGTIES